MPKRKEYNFVLRFSLKVTILIIPVSIWWLNFCYLCINSETMNDYKQIITIEPGKRGGKPCIRGMRITVADILGWLASGMTIGEILSDYDELTETDIYAALSFAADRENKIYQVAV
jgi:uncharacterized protein (DUF433 family)